MFRWETLLTVMLSFLAASGSALAADGAAPEITTEAGTAYPAGTRQDAFVSESDDPTAVFRNRAVLFKGWDGDGDRTKVGEAFRVYRFRIRFKQPVLLREVEIRGAGDQRNGALVRVLDTSGKVLASTSPTSFNTLTTMKLMVGAVASEFILEEYDQSSTYRLRERIHLVWEKASGKR